MTIDAYLQAMKERFVTDPIVRRSSVIRERSTLVDGYPRARLVLADGSQLEFSEYMQRSSAGEIVVITYSYHWVDANNQLIRRWDNAPHFPGLPGFPDHRHDGATGEVTPGQPMSIFTAGAFSFRGPLLLVCSLPLCTGGGLGWGCRTVQQSMRSLPPHPSLPPQCGGRGQKPRAARGKSRTE